MTDQPTTPTVDTDELRALLDEALVVADDCCADNLSRRLERMVATLARLVPAAPAEPEHRGVTIAKHHEAKAMAEELGKGLIEHYSAAPAEPGATEVCPDCNHHPGDHYENADGCVEGLCFCRRVYAAEPGGECEHVRLTWEDGAYECDTCGRRGFLAAAPPAPADDEAVPEDRPPVWLLLDLWVAMGGDSTDFDSWWAADPSFPDRWAQMVAAVGGNISDLAADSNPPAGTLLDIAIGRQPSTSPAAAVPEERDEDESWKATPGLPAFFRRSMTKMVAAGGVPEGVHRFVYLDLDSGKRTTGFIRYGANPTEHVGAVRSYITHPYHRAVDHVIATECDDVYGVLDGTIALSHARPAPVTAAPTEHVSPQGWRHAGPRPSPSCGPLCRDAAERGDPEPAANCAAVLGSRPGWMSPDQYDPCRCDLPEGHEASSDDPSGHSCRHVRPAAPTEALCPGSGRPLIDDLPWVGVPGWCPVCGARLAPTTAGLAPDHQASTAAPTEGEA